LVPTLCRRFLSNIRENQNCRPTPQDCRYCQYHFLPLVPKVASSAMPSSAHNRSRSSRWYPTEPNDSLSPADTKPRDTGIRACHERWRTLAFTFCDCFLGDKEKAATAAQEAFTTFLLDSCERDHNRVPLMLLQYALGCALDQSSRETTPQATDEMERIVPRLPAERAVFILRGILDLSPFEVAVIGRTTSDEVHRLWTDSLLHLRDLWVKPRAVP